MLLAAILSYGYGLTTIIYQSVPYHQIKWIANLVTSGHQVTDDRHSYSPHYLIKQSFFELHGGQADVVMIGDSLTDHAEWGELFPGISIVNRGVTGDTTRGVLNRMDSISSTRANKAFVMIGINDLTQKESTEDVFSNYEEIITELKSNGITPFVQSTILAGDSKKELNEMIEALNCQLEALSQREGLVFIDLNRGLTKDGSLDKSFSVDDVHLNGEGYLVWKRSIEEYVN